MATWEGLTIHDILLYTDSITDSEKAIPALTGIDRSTWAKIRTQQFSSGVNKESLQIIESAILCVSTDCIKQYPILCSSC